MCSGALEQELDRFYVFGKVFSRQVALLQMSEIWFPGGLLRLRNAGTSKACQTTYTQKHLCGRLCYQELGMTLWLVRRCEIVNNARGILPCPNLFTGAKQERLFFDTEYT